MTILGSSSEALWPTLAELSTPLVVDLGRREDAGHAGRILDALEKMIRKSESVGGDEQKSAT